MKQSLVTLIAMCMGAPAVPASAQQPQCARGVPAVDLGVSYAASPSSEEPRIDAVDARGPASGRLQNGDLIARVNGYSIGTPQAAAALRDGKPGKAVVLTVRRSDRLVPVTVTPTRVSCTTVAALQPTRAMVAPARAAGTTASQPAASYARIYASPPGWLGMGFVCSECDQRVTTAGNSWVFSEPPTIYNVDTGSPAYAAGIRRGDVLLRVDGTDVRAPVAGVRLAQVQPGETLRLTYRRANRTSDAVVRAARSPVEAVAAERTGEPLNRLKATQELRVAQSELDLRRLYTELERSVAAQRTLTQQLERTLADGNSAAARSARSTLNQLQRLQSESAASAQRALETTMRVSEEAGVLERRPFARGQAALTERAVEGGRMDSVVSPARTDRLRYSGSIGDSDVEVRGPGSVNVQRVGDDLVIVTGDAVVRITQRKSRGGS